MAAVTTLPLIAAAALQDRASGAGMGFVTGPENAMVAKLFGQLAEVVQQHPLVERWRAFSPITLVGPPGSGKSHLLEGLAHLRDLAHRSWSEQSTDQSLPEHLLVTAVDFRRRFDLALRENQVEAFRARLRECDLLLIDDLHRLAGGERVEEELIQTFDAIHQRGGLVVVASLKAPINIGTVGRRLISRLAAGLTAEIAPLSDQTRCALLQQAIESRGGRLEPSALADLSHHLSGDARRVLKAAADLGDRFGYRHPITLSQTRAFLADQPRGNTPPLRQIAMRVAKYYRLPLSDLKSQTRKQSVVLARAVAIYLARELTPLSYDEIGRFFGGRDHSTIMHNYRRIDRGIATDRAMRVVIEDLKHKVQEGQPA